MNIAGSRAEERCWFQSPERGWGLCSLHNLSRWRARLAQSFVVVAEEVVVAEAAAASVEAMIATIGFDESPIPRAGCYRGREEDLLAETHGGCEGGWGPWTTVVGKVGVGKAPHAETLPLLLPIFELTGWDEKAPDVDPGCRCSQREIQEQLEGRRWCRLYCLGLVVSPRFLPVEAVVDGLAVVDALAVAAE